MRVSQVRGLSRAMNESCLKELFVNDLEEMLFSYSSKLFATSNRLAAGAGAVGIAGGIAVAAAETEAVAVAAGAGIGVPVMAVGAGIAAIGLLYDKIPALRPLSRSTIWFVTAKTKKNGSGLPIDLVMSMLPNGGSLLTHWLFRRVAIAARR